MLLTIEKLSLKILRLIPSYDAARYRVAEAVQLAISPFRDHIRGLSFDRRERGAAVEGIEERSGGVELPRELLRLLPYHAAASDGMADRVQLAVRSPRDDVSGVDLSLHPGEAPSRKRLLKRLVHRALYFTGTGNALNRAQRAVRRTFGKSVLSDLIVREIHSGMH